MTAQVHCRFPFAHLPQDCTCTPNPGSFLLRSAEQNERYRKEQDRANRWTLIAVFAAVSIASFCTMYAVSAIVDRGMDNIADYRAAHAPV